MQLHQRPNVGLSGLGGACDLALADPRTTQAHGGKGTRPGAGHHRFPNLLTSEETQNKIGKSKMVEK
jgi:hypothetical protein